MIATDLAPHSMANSELEILAIAGHGAAITVHVLGGAFEYLEARTWKDIGVIFHAICVGISTYAVVRHIKKAKRHQHKERQEQWDRSKRSSSS